MIKSRICLLFLLLSITLTIKVRGQAVTTIAGSAGVSGAIDGTGNNARFNSPHGICTDRNGNIYIADRYNHRIRKITPAGMVSTIAGSGVIGGMDGVGASASFNEPWAVDCDTAGNIYVADTRNYKIRMVTPSGVVSTVAGQGTFGTTNGPAVLAKFGFPSGICVTPDGSTIYVADHNTHVIRKIIGGVVSNLTGITYIAGSDDGPVGTATINHPYGITLDNSGNIIVADEWNNMIRKVDPAGTVTTLAGVGLNGSNDGQPSSAMFNYPWDVTVDNNGNIYVADGFNHTIRKLESPFWIVSTYVGTPGVTGATDAIGAAASFNAATGITYYAGGNSLFVGDASNQLVRKISAVSALQITLSTTATANTVCFGDSIPVASSISGLPSYIFYDNGSVIATSTTASANLPPLTAGNHTITCSSTDSAGLTVMSTNLVITVKSAYIPTITPANPMFCNGDSIQISSSSAVSYLWNDGSTQQNIYINSSGPFTVTAMGADGCDGSATITAIVSNGPGAAVTPATNASICPGDSMLLTVSSGTSYLWSDGSTSQSIYASATTPYLVTVSDVAGCKSISSPYTLNFYPGSVATINPSGPIVLIQGDSITLSSGAAATYLWNDGSTSQNITVNSNGSYFVTITTSDGCSSSSLPVQVSIINLSQILTAQGATSFCDGQSVTLQSAFSTGNQWYFNGQLISGETAQEIVASDSGYFQVAVSQNGNLYFSDSILVSVLATPQMALATDTTVCSGTTPLLVVQADQFATVNWYDVDTGGTILGSGNAYVTPPLAQTSTYYIEVVGSNGCKPERTELMVMTNPTPIADFTYVISGQPGNFTITITNTTLQGDYYNWTLQDTAAQISQIVNPVFTVANAGSYNVWLVADNASGCQDSVLKTIYIGANDDWFIPNTFTPNNDGKNDLFRVRGRGVLTKEIKIYDQWGGLIYLSDVNPVWDGTVHGETVPNGTYMYHVVISKDDQEQVVTGAITVIK